MHALAAELGGALWCLSALATALEVPLGEVATRNLEKLRRRYPDGFDAARNRGTER
jgi:NTP pyrophosphatase (non-canonical NTP hydrolase)